MLVHEFFDSKGLDAPTHPNEVAAHGAAIMAATLSRKLTIDDHRTPILVDVLAHSIAWARLLETSSPVRRLTEIDWTSPTRL